MFECNETIGTLMDYENDHVIVFCIAADTSTAKEDEWYAERYGVPKKEIIWSTDGRCVLKNNGKIIYLIDKPNQQIPPTFQSLKTCLWELRLICLEHGFRKIVMPKIESKYFEWSKIYNEGILWALGDIEDMEIRVVYQEDKELRILDPDMEKIHYGEDRKGIDGNTRYKYY